MERIARWLESLATSEVFRDALDFIEPHLQLLFVVQPVFAVEVRFAYECAPPWLDKETPEREEGFGVQFPLSLNDPQAAVRSLRHDLIRFPPRAALIDLDEEDYPTSPRQ